MDQLPEFIVVPNAPKEETLMPFGLIENSVESSRETSVETSVETPVLSSEMPKEVESPPPPPPPQTSALLSSPRKIPKFSPKTESYQLKWIKFRGNKCPIVTQNENGPCPLIALINVLLLKNHITLPPMMETITPNQLIEYLGDCILESIPKNLKDEEQLNYEQNMHDAIAILSKLLTGLDVNVRFTSVSDFEYTPELIFFDLLHIPLYHGWLVDPESVLVAIAVGNCSYNQLVDKIISNKSSSKPELVTEALTANQFLEKTASQLTYYGLSELIETVKEGELCVFFRNNHFITLLKHKGLLYQLVTDQGFLNESNVVWETLNNIENDGEFVDSNFAPVPPKAALMTEEEKLLQVDHDYLIALSIDEEQKKMQNPLELEGICDASQLSDEELARRLQEKERLRLEAYQAQQERQKPPQSPPASISQSSSQTSQQSETRSSSRYLSHREGSQIKKSNSRTDESSGKSKCSLM